MTIACLLLSVLSAAYYVLYAAPDLSRRCMPYTVCCLLPLNLTGRRIRRSRRRTRTTKVEKILVLKKSADALPAGAEGPVAVCDRPDRKRKTASRRDCSQP